MVSFKGTFFDENENLKAKVMQGIYNLCVISAIILVFLSYKFEQKEIFKIMPFALIVFRNAIRIFDFENS